MTYELAKELKASGFPQPEPKNGQIWWSPFTGSLCVCCNRGDTGEQKMLAPIGLIEWSHKFGAGGFLPGAIEVVFIPTLDDIAPLLPGGYRLEEYKFKQSCTNMFDEGDPLKIRTFGDTFAEAAATMWLELKKQK